MEIINSLEDLNLNKKYNIKENKRVLFYLPDVCRCIVNGASGCGKTNLILNLMLKLFEKYENKIRLQICTKTIEQELYQRFIEDIKNKYGGKHQINVSKTISYFDNEYFENLTDFKEIIIIDDMLGVINSEDKKALTHLFSASRPRKISIFFLTQRYTKVEISCRRNCNYLISFKPSLEEAITMCNELVSFMYPSELVSRFENNAHFSLFFDLEKLKCMTVYEVFKICSLNYYNSVDDLIDKLEILYGEYKAGNDSEIIFEEFSNILKELEFNGIITSF